MPVDTMPSYGTPSDVMPIDKMPLDEMSVDEMLASQKKLHWKSPQLDYCGEATFFKTLKGPEP